MEEIQRLILSRQRMEEKDLITHESATGETSVPTSSEPLVTGNESSKKTLVDDSTGTLGKKVMTACSQSTSNQPHGEGFESDCKILVLNNSTKKSSTCEQFDTTPTVSGKLLTTDQPVPPCVSTTASLGSLTPPMPGLIPLQQTALLSHLSPTSSSPTPLATQFPALQPGLQDLVQVSSDSGSVDSHGNAGRCREYRKKRKRVLSECERELEKIIASNTKLKRVVARLEYRVGKLKAFYIHSVLNSRYKCINSESTNMKK